LSDFGRIGIWESLSGETPLSSYGVGSTESLLSKMPKKHIDFLTQRCRDFYESDEFIFVHGGIRPHLAPEDDDLDHLHWLTLSVAVPHFSGKTVVCGHSSQASGEIADLGHTICVDTGITKGQFISCLNLDDFSFWRVGEDCVVTEGRLSGKC